MIVPAIPDLFAHASRQGLGQVTPFGIGVVGIVVVSGKMALDRLQDQSIFFGGPRAAASATSRTTAGVTAGTGAVATTASGGKGAALFGGNRRRVLAVAAVAAVTAVIVAAGIAGNGVGFSRGISGSILPIVLSDNRLMSFAAVVIL